MSHERTRIPGATHGRGWLGPGRAGHLCVALAGSQRRRKPGGEARLRVGDTPEMRWAGDTGSPRSLLADL